MILLWYLFIHSFNCLEHDTYLVFTYKYNELITDWTDKSVLAVFPADFGLAMLINPITVKQLIDGRIHMTLNKVIPKGRMDRVLFAKYQKLAVN